MASVLTGFVFSPVGLLPTIEGGGRELILRQCHPGGEREPGRGYCPHASHPVRHGAHGRSTSARHGATADHTDGGGSGANGLGAAERARIRAAWARKMAAH
ncbi:hypothetical protein RAA17_04840 [Komagataeibacter rhaeticus]|nr:hypothetical protein [Komagataeibacter rhaeticus]